MSSKCLSNAGTAECECVLVGKPIGNPSYPVEQSWKAQNWQQKEQVHERVIIRQKWILIESLFKIRAPRHPCLFYKGSKLLSQFPLIQKKKKKKGGSFPEKSKTENLGTIWNETWLRAGVPFWKEGIQRKLPNALPYWARTSLAARSHSLGRRLEDPFLETKQLKKERFKDSVPGVP